MYACMYACAHFVHCMYVYTVDISSQHVFVCLKWSRLVDNGFRHSLLGTFPLELLLSDCFGDMFRFP